MAHAAAQTSELYIEINDHRPLAMVVQELADRHGLQITYEDPRWAHESDLVDNTDQFKGALERLKSGQGPRFLGPRKQKLELEYEVSEVTGIPEDVTALLDRLLVAYADSECSGEFRWQRIGEIVHLIPTTVKNAAGELVMHTSILDIPIDLETEDRTIMQTIREVKGAINRVSDTPFSLGMIVIKPFQQNTVRIGASGDTAREILQRAMTSIDLKTSWVMFYNPVSQRYVFSVYPVREHPSAGRPN